MRILVTGAAGYIGGRLLELLSRQDWVESLAATDIRRPRRLPDRCAFHAQDIRSPLDDVLQREKIDTVVHTAFVLAPLHDTALMEDINRNGTRAVMDAAARARVEQLLYTSSTAAYGFHPDNDQPLTEESPLRGNDDFVYARNKREIEAMLAEYGSTHPEMKITILRPCFVVGSGFRNLMAEYLKRKLVVIPSRTGSWQFVHEDDLVAVMALLIERRIAGAFNVAGEGSLTFPEMIAALGNIAVPVPWPLLRILADLGWHLRLRWLSPSPSPPLRMMVEPWIASSGKLQRVTGYRFRHDSRAAFLDFVRSVSSAAT